MPGSDECLGGIKKTDSLLGEGACVRWFSGNMVIDVGSPSILAGDVLD